MTSERHQSSVPAEVEGQRWWLPKQVPNHDTLHCTMGPLVLQLQRTPDEWRVAWDYVEEIDGGSTAVLEPRSGAFTAESYERYAFLRASGRIRLHPMLADRSVVVRPRYPVFLSGGEETTLYLSSPVHLQLQVGEPPVTLRELPMVLLSETWFGPNTREGELCYSSRTAARQSASEVPRRVHRALTTVHIRNQASSALPLEKFALPVPALSVYGAPDGSLWTQGISLVRSGHSDMAAMRVDKTPPARTGGLELISGPRREHERGALVRAFDLLFGD